MMYKHCNKYHDSTVARMGRGGVTFDRDVQICRYDNYTVSQKKGDAILLSISSLNIDRFS